MKGTKEYMATKVTPVLEEVLTEVARCKPSDPTAFIVNILKTGATPGPEESVDGDYESAMAGINDTMAALLRKLMVDQVSVQWNAGADRI